MGKNDKKKTAKIGIIYQKDSRRYKRYAFDENEWGIVGNVYFPKDKPAPEKVEFTVKESL